jgi:hypothetical protein
MNILLNEVFIQELYNNIKGNLFPITNNHLYSLNTHNYYEPTVIYKVTRLPKFGKLQFRTESIYSDFGSHSNIVYFTQKDIDEGKGWFKVKL